nr:MAG TPA: Protein of unknown function (DUF3675) [Caudoviricetes sp.]
MAFHGFRMYCCRDFARIFMIFLLYSNLKKMIKTIATNSKMIRTVHF